jgi:hypothetical protein
MGVAAESSASRSGRSVPVMDYVEKKNAVADAER